MFLFSLLAFVVPGSAFVSRPFAMKDVRRARVRLGTFMPVWCSFPLSLEKRNFENSMQKKHTQRDQNLHETWLSCDVTKTVAAAAAAAARN
jgi:hypothetical protein